jgi:CRP-like cAMP-binding protein
MLRRLSIQNRSPGELRELAAERRELAVGKNISVRTLLLNEARLLEYHADLRLWMQQTELASQERPATSYRGGSAATSWMFAPEVAPLLTALRSRMVLPMADQHALLAAAASPRRIAKDEAIVEAGEWQPSLLFLCSGTARAYRTLEDGSQQNVAVFLAGDALNPGDLVLGPSRSSIGALGPSVVIEIPFVHLTALMAEHPKIMRALWMETALQAAIQREWIVWLGRRSAESRLAHFLCEISCRLELGGEACVDAFQFPLTQRELADTIGLSPVHVNRVLQSLRRQGLIELDRNQLIIRRKGALYSLAEFDPGYLEVPGFVAGSEEQAVHHPHSPQAVYPVHATPKD